MKQTELSFQLLCATVLLGLVAALASAAAPTTRAPLASVTYHVSR